MTALLDNAPMIGLLMFFTMFVWIAFSAYRPRAKQQLDAHAFIPLREEPNHDER